MMTEQDEEDLQECLEIILNRLRTLEAGLETVTKVLFAGEHEETLH